MDEEITITKEELLEGLEDVEEALLEQFEDRLGVFLYLQNNSNIGELIKGLEASAQETYTVKFQN